jgi:MFS transporter, PAT family, beta-lactamase induction signal transducer AmpG
VTDTLHSVGASRSAQRTRTLAAITLLGFGSGLPVALSFSTLEAWCAVSGMSLKAIGAIKLVALAYVFKFLWAPLLDRYSPPLLSGRRGWMLWMQVGIIIVLALIAGLSPQTSLPAIVLLAILLATFSATQDIAVDAYRADQLLPQDRGLGAAFGVGGYRIAMVVSGGFTLILAGLAGFRFAYLAMAAFMCVGIVGTLTAPEQHAAEKTVHSLAQAYIEPLREFLTRTKALHWLALILIYKLGNAFALSLSSTFLLRGAGYALTDVGWVNKVFGLAATVVGAFVGGLLLERWSLRRALWVFGVLQGLGALGFLAIALGWLGFPALVTAVAAENFTSGLGTGAFVALLMALCDKRFSATQYALFSALDSASRIFVGPIAGWVAADYGWIVYFGVSLVCAVPGLILLASLHKQFAQFDTSPEKV